MERVQQEESKVRGRAGGLGGEGPSPAPPALCVSLRPGGRKPWGSGWAWPSQTEEVGVRGGVEGATVLGTPVLGPHTLPSGPG